MPSRGALSSVIKIQLLILIIRSSLLSQRRILVLPACHQPGQVPQGGHATDASSHRPPQPCYRRRLLGRQGLSIVRNRNHPLHFSLQQLIPAFAEAPLPPPRETLLLPPLPSRAVFIRQRTRAAYVCSLPDSTPRITLQRYNRFCVFVGKVLPIMHTNCPRKEWMNVGAVALMYMETIAYLQIL